MLKNCHWPLPVLMSQRSSRKMSLVLANNVAGLVCRPFWEHVTSVWYSDVGQCHWPLPLLVLPCWFWNMSVDPLRWCCWALHVVLNDASLLVNNTCASYHSLCTWCARRICRFSHAWNLLLTRLSQNRTISWLSQSNRHLRHALSCLILDEGTGNHKLIAHRFPEFGNPRR